MAPHQPGSGSHHFSEKIYSLPLAAPRMTLNYSPEEKKTKYQVLLSPPDFIFGIFEIFTSTRILDLAKFLKIFIFFFIESFSGHFKKKLFFPQQNIFNTNYFEVLKNLAKSKILGLSQIFNNLYL